MVMTHNSNENNIGNNIIFIGKVVVVKLSLHGINKVKILLKHCAPLELQCILQ